MTRPIFRLVTPPAALPVDLSTVWAHLNLILEPTDESPVSMEPIDANYVEELTRAAVARLDGPRGLLNRCLITQTWTVSLPRFGGTAIRMPTAGVTEIVSVEYVAADGSPKTLPTADYLVTGEGTDQCRIRRAAGKVFPSTEYDNPEAVVITFTAGFGDAAEDVPTDIQLAIAEMVATAYNAQLPAGSMPPLPSAANRVATDWTSWSGTLNGGLVDG